MGLFRDSKPYTAISADIERLVAERNEDPARLLDLIEIIQAHPTSGPLEGGRALRKKLKYGRVSEQHRALTVVEMLIDNGGKKMTPLVTDSGLGDVIATLAGSSNTGNVGKQARTLVIRWARHPELRLTQYEKQAGIRERPNVRNSVGPHELGVSNGHAGDGAKISNPRRQSRRLSFARSVHQPDGPWSRAEDDDLDIRSGSAPGLPPRSARPRSAVGSRNRSRSRSPSPLPNLRSASLTTTVATAHSVATRLVNSLIVGSGARSHDAQIYARQCKEMRHRVVQLIHDPSPEVQQYLEQLLNANQDIVSALQSYDASLDGTPLPDVPIDDIEPLRHAPIKPLRQAPSPKYSSPDNSDDSSDVDKHNPPGSPFASAPAAVKGDPFADDNEQAEHPRHVPMW